MSAIRALLCGSIDYAGLFPPAGLDMAAAVSNYAQYRTGPAAWALGRFILPAGRLAELEPAAQRHLPRDGSQPWLLSALAGSDLAMDLKRIGEFNDRHAARGATVDTFEAKATSEGEIKETMHRMPPGLQPYIEIPIERDPSSLIDAIGRAGGRAKVRTGGVTPDAFPRTANLVRFLRRCVHAGVPFKATAGLHHPLRAEYRLTYAPNSPSGPMFGFLNVFLTAAFLREGMPETDAVRLLEEGSAEALQLDDRGAGWRGYRLDLKSLTEARQEGMISFGSCSFTEPIGDLEALQLLQPRAQRA